MKRGQEVGKDKRKARILRYSSSSGPYVGQQTLLAIVDAWDRRLALRYEVVIADVVR